MRTQSAKREARGARETKIDLSIKKRPDFPLTVILAQLRYLDASQGREVADKHLRWLGEYFLFADDGAYRIDPSTSHRTIRRREGERLTPRPTSCQSFSSKEE